MSCSSCACNYDLEAPVFSGLCIIEHPLRCTMCRNNSLLKNSGIDNVTLFSNLTWDVNRPQLVKRKVSDIKPHKVC